MHHSVITTSYTVRHGEVIRINRSTLASLEEVARRCNGQLVISKNRTGLNLSLTIGNFTSLWKPNDPETGITSLTEFVYEELIGRMEQEVADET